MRRVIHVSSLFSYTCYSMATPGLYIDTNTLQVGIGTTRPQEAFHVQGNLLSTGNITSQGTVTASNLSILGDFVTLNTITSNTEQMVIQNAGTGPALKVTQTGANTIAEFYDDGNVLALKIADGGNVGIGTATPKAKLHVQGTAQATTFSGKLEHTLTKGDYLTGTNFTNETSTSWAVDATSANTASKVVARDASGNFSAGLVRAANGTVGLPSFSWTDDTDNGLYLPATNTIGVVTAGAERIRVLSNGNVGIGTEIAKSKLHVQGACTVENAGTGPALKVTQTGANSIAEFYDDGNALALKIADGGNVGIGVINPEYKLEVAGILRAGTSIGDAILLSNKEVKLRGDGQAHFSIFNESSTFSIRNTSVNSTLGTPGTQVISIPSTNNVGIGTATPREKLDINGNLLVSGFIKSNKGVIQVVDAQLKATAVLSTSSSTLQPVGLTVSITPSFISSKIKVEFFSGMCGGANYLNVDLQRSINGGTWTSFGVDPHYWLNISGGWQPLYGLYWDSPNTILPVTYRVAYRSQVNGEGATLIYVNSYYGWSVMEVGQ